MESVLRQTWPDIEYLIVDGGSDDGTLELIREYEPKFKGPNAADAVGSNVADAAGSEEGGLSGSLKRLRLGSFPANWFERSTE